MFNQVVLVGRLVRTPELYITDNGKKMSGITLAVSRGYKNVNGEYDTDFLDCTLWTGIAENTAEYCKSGDIIGIKGRLQTRLIDNEDGTKYKKMDIIAEKVTFISTTKNINNEEENVGNEDDSCSEVTDVSFIKESERKYKKRKSK